MPSSPWSPEAYGRAGRLPSASKQELRGRRVRMNRAGPLLAPAELSALNPSQSLAGLRPPRLRRVRRHLRGAVPGPRPLLFLYRVQSPCRGRFRAHYLLLRLHLRDLRHCPRLLHPRPLHFPFRSPCRPRHFHYRIPSRLSRHRPPKQMNSRFPPSSRRCPPFLPLHLVGIDLARDAAK